MLADIVDSCEEWHRLFYVYQEESKDAWEKLSKLVEHKFYTLLIEMSPRIIRLTPWFTLVINVNGIELLGLEYQFHSILKKNPINTGNKTFILKKYLAWIHDYTHKLVYAVDTIRYDDKTRKLVFKYKSRFAMTKNYPLTKQLVEIYYGELVLKKLSLSMLKLFRRNLRESGG